MRFSRKQFDGLVTRAMRDIPAPFAAYLKEVAVVVEPEPDPDTCRDLGLEDPTDLMGLYHGAPLTERSVQDSFDLPDRIVIYQRGIEAAADSAEELVSEIRKTVLHEVGHHFGLDEDDLEELGYQ